MHLSKKILVCPLDWGLGHAARDVAIIKRLLDLGHQVILAADGNSMKLLKVEFPELETVSFRSMIRIRYSRRLPAWMKISLLSPLLLCEVCAEHFRLMHLVRKLEPDVVISDNRYGLWNRNVTSILVTHQLSIRLPQFARFLEYPAYLVMRAFAGKFDHCWIPDFPGDKNLSGDLSHRWRLPGNAVFIGPISRFVDPGPTIVVQAVKPADLLIMLSGPEPQRSRLQKIVLLQSLSLKCRCIILQGMPGRLRRTDLTATVTMYNHLPAGELKHLLLVTGKVICRAGYTGIMDLALLKKKALIIPTPGQPEQEYLAEYLAGRGLFKTCGQDELDIESVLEEMKQFQPDFDLPEGNLLEAALKSL